jgi:hypothetical protein
MANTRNLKKNVKQNKPGHKDHPKKATEINDVTRKVRGASKQATLIKLLERPGGASIDEMAKATGWQGHSIRGMMSGVLKKRLGLSIASEKEERGRIYRIAA